ncbi:LacI family transcriptional regulator [Spirochaetia bacterium]|nr:LacI family transcriptional regulator [Spirochaetia bacterium]
MATSKDVAKLAGVSHTTVSRAFKGGERMRKETYDRILQAAGELHYSPNLLAAGLRSQKSSTAGIVISHSGVAFFMNLVQELENQLQRQGFRLLISFDSGDPEKQQNAFQAMSSARADSIAFMPIAPPPKKKTEMLEQMKASGIQYIQLFNDALDGFGSVLIDDVGGALAGTRHLLDKGHRRILMIGGYNRIEGFYKAYEEKKLSAPIPHLPLLDDDLKICRNNIRQAIIERKPTAVFCISDQIGAITYGILSELKYHVPDDISFLAFDDSFWSESLSISVIGQPIAEIAGNIAGKIFSYSRGADAPRSPASSRTVFTPFLIERNSIRDISQ